MIKNCPDKVSLFSPSKRFCSFNLYLFHVHTSGLATSNCMVKQMSMYDINLMPTVDVNLMSTIDVTKTFLFDL